MADKTYKFRFTKAVFILILAGIALAVGAAAFAAYRIAVFGFASVSLGI